MEKFKRFLLWSSKGYQRRCFYAYNYTYSGKKPSNDEIYKAIIDELKPIGEKFEMSKTISD